MEKISEFKKLLGSDVTFLYPRLDQPYRWDNQEKKTVPCKPTVQGANWNVTFSVDAERGEALRKVCEDHFKAVKGEKAKFFGVFGSKVNEETGEITFRAKRNCVTKAGDLAKDPVVYSRFGEILDEEGRRFWTGSKGDIKVIAFPSEDPQTGNQGISLLLDKVVVRDAKHGDIDPDFEFDSPLDDDDEEQANEPVAQADDGDIFDEEK